MSIRPNLRSSKRSFLLLNRSVIFSILPLHRSRSREVSWSNTHGICSWSSLKHDTSNDSSYEGRSSYKVYGGASRKNVRCVSGLSRNNGYAQSLPDEPSTAQFSLPLKSTKFIEKRIKWGLLDRELSTALDGFEQDLAQKTNQSKTELSERHNLSERSRDEIAGLDDMPLSPLMDANLYRARRRYREPKSFPSSERTEFQTLLAKNPYGTFAAFWHFCIADCRYSENACNSRSFLFHDLYPIAVSFLVTI